LVRMHGNRQRRCTPTVEMCCRKATTACIGMDHGAPIATERLQVGKFANEPFGKEGGKQGELPERPWLLHMESHSLLCSYEMGAARISYHELHLPKS
jgi:hypothetical protein